jgi:ribulose-5-phosphate 4-epimerase/fuculose-1-phosphate aldolase
MANEKEVEWASTDPEHPVNLIPELCKLFYSLGWVTGTGGGMTIRQGYIYPNKGNFIILLRPECKRKG